MAQSKPTRDLGKWFQGTAAGTGGTFTADYPIPIDTTVKLRATIIASHATAAHLDGGASIVCEAVFQSKNTVVTLPAATSGSNNPATSATTTFVAAAAQASDAGLWSGGVPTATFSVSGTNGRCTFTNTGTASTVNVTIWIDAWIVGST